MAERRVVNLLRAALPSVLSTATALALGFLAIAFTRAGFSGAAAAYGQMLKGGVGDWSQLFEGGAATVVTRPLGETSVKAALLILTGLSVSVAFWVGLFNIGAQGQLLVGALTAAVLGAALPLPAALHIPVCLLGAALGGGLYALIPAVLRERRGVHEVLSTIMLNWIAVSVIESWLVTGPLRARSEGTSSRSGTEPILASAQLPRLLEDGSRLHLGFLLALVLAAVVWVWLYRTWHGFEIRAAGLGPRAAQTAGIPVRRRIYQAMALSGALAGLAGAVLVQGTELQYPGILAAPYGFDGIAMAMLGQSHPLGVVLVSVFFGALRAGGTRMQLLGVHKSFPELIQGLALLLVAGRLLWRRLQAREPTPTDPDPDPVGEVETNARPGGGAVNVLAFVEALLSSTLNALPALVFAALGAVLTERSGVIDIGVEGMMRVGAYFAAVAALVMPTPLAVMVGMAAGAGLAAVHALLSLVLRANQVVSGMALNLVALAGITFLLESRYGPSGTPPITSLAHWDLPLLGGVPLLRSFSHKTALVYLALLLPFALHGFLFHTAPGLRLRAVGEKPAAAASVGISVLRVRWGATVVGGLLAGLGGAVLSTSTLDRFEQHMPAGLGFVALAAMVFGRWTPRGAFFAAVFFAAANALRISLASSAPRVLDVVPAGILLAFPYLLTLLLLSVRAVRSRAPAALGSTWEPERRAL